MKREPLDKEQVKKAIEYQNPSRVPLMIHFWNYGISSPEYKAGIEEVLKDFPCDFNYYFPIMPGYEYSSLEGIDNYRWVCHDSSGRVNHALDSQLLIEDWEALEEVLLRFPNPGQPGIFRQEDIDHALKHQDKYIVSTFSNLFFERLWSLRGMENTLTDFLLYPDETKQLLSALCNFYKVIIKRSKYELHSDALLVTDDLGAQNSLMFSPGIFLEFIKPLFREIADECHRHGMHLWLHSCGNITEIMEDLIEVGVDVIHPIQKYAMDQEDIARKYRGKICFWAGMDMQIILKNGSTDDVRRETRFLIDSFDSPDGGLLLGAGNGITEDMPLDNVRAFLDEALEYGIQHRKI